MCPMPRGAESLTGRTIVICRPRHQGAELAEALEARGATVVIVSLVEVAEPREGTDSLTTALQAGHDWIVFTSANAVAAARRAATRWPPRASLAAIGSATAAALSASGASVDFVSPVATANALAETVPGKPGSRVLAPLAELAGPDLVDGLERRGFSVTAVEAYRLVEVDEVPAQVIAAARGADAVLLTSPSLADRFAEVLGGWPPVVISIGPRTSRRLAQLGVTVTLEADPHSGDGLISAVVTTLGT